MITTMRILEIIGITWLFSIFFCLKIIRKSIDNKNKITSFLLSTGVEDRTILSYSFVPILNTFICFTKLFLTFILKLKTF
jgi:hypothetical protein